MPIYEYQCDNCQHKMEAIQKISDAPLKECPECEQATLRKLVSAAAFKLSGTGWYETDFKDKKPTSKESVDKDAKSKDADKEDKKSPGNKDNDKTDTKKETHAKESNDTSKSGVKPDSKPNKPKQKESTTD